MFVIKFLGLAFVLYIILTIAIPAVIGAYYGAKLWKRYSKFYTIVPKEMVDKWFSMDLQLHIVNHPYMRFLSKF